jgi:hypothetical protein
LGSSLDHFDVKKGVIPHVHTFQHSKYAKTG